MYSPRSFKERITAISLVSCEDHKYMHHLFNGVTSRKNCLFWVMILWETCKSTRLFSSHIISKPVYLFPFTNYLFSAHLWFRLASLSNFLELKWLDTIADIDFVLFPLLASIKTPNVQPSKSEEHVFQDQKTVEIRHNTVFFSCGALVLK